MTFQPPGSGMELEESTVYQCKPLNEGIATPSVLTLVRQYGLELRLRPLTPVFRENHHWVDESHGYRRGAQRTSKHVVVEHRVVEQLSCADGAYC